MPQFPSKIVGTSFRTKEEKAYLETLEAGDQLDLKREYDNEHDPNAIMVLHDGVHIGYIPRDTAEGLAAQIDAGDKADAVIQEMTGAREGREHRGVNLTITVVHADLTSLNSYNPFL